MPDHDFELSRRKALAALGTIGGASVGAGLGTSAYFSDRETFDNNRLVAGELDVKAAYSAHYSDWSDDEDGSTTDTTDDDVSVRMYDGSAGTVGGASDLESGETGLPTTDDWLVAVDDPDQFLDNTETGAEGVATCGPNGTDADDLDQPVIDLTDVKPGDFGEITVDFALCDNPGFVQLSADLRGKAENGTTEPEADDPDETDGRVELLDVVQAAVWVDDGNNYQNGGEEPVVVGSLRDVLDQFPDDGRSAGVMNAGNAALVGDLPAEQGGGTGRNCFSAQTTHSVAFAWWVPVDHGNEIQTDAASFDLGLYTEQCRHNDGRIGERFQCPDTQQAKLSRGDSNDRFGASVVIDDDTALIGAWGDEDPNGETAGSAYVFTRTGGAWTFQAKLTPDDGARNDRFGISVALDGDTALIGASADSTIPTDPDGFLDGAGSAYVFTRSGTSWSQQARLFPDPNGGPGSFGVSVAVDDDTALIGAFQDEQRGFGAGAAYVFTRSDGTWNRTQKLLADDALDNFGIDVALDGDTALIGARFDEGLGGTPSAVGAAYVYTRPGTTWSRQQKLAPSDGAMDPESDQFGASVALDEDTVIIGAPADDNPNGNSAGSAYVYTRNGTTWSRQQKLLADDGDGFDDFGSVAMNGDTALVGASGDEDPNGEDAGSAYVFGRSDGRWERRCKLAAQDATADTVDRFGGHVALSDSTALIGAPSDEDPNGEDAGSAYVFVP